MCDFFFFFFKPDVPRSMDNPGLTSTHHKDTHTRTIAMNSPAPEIVAGYTSGCVADKDANPETTLGSAYSPVDYMSITSFPRLPEDDMLSGEHAIKSRKDDDNVLSEQDTGESARSDTVATKYTLHKHYG